MYRPKNCMECGGTFQKGGKTLPNVTVRSMKDKEKAYQDSLTLYKQYLHNSAQLKKLHPKAKGAYQPYSAWDKEGFKNGWVGDVYLPTYRDFKLNSTPGEKDTYFNNRRIKGILPTGSDVYIFDDDEQYGIPVYKKPTRPVQPEELMKFATRTRSLPVEDIQVPTPNPNATPVDIDTEVRPTNFNYTYRDEAAPTKQSTAYFKDLAEWQQFTDGQNYIKRDQAADGKSAQGVGYLRLRRGGLPKAQVGTQMPEEEIVIPGLEGTQYFQTGYTQDAFGNYQANGYDANNATYEQAERAEEFSTTNPMLPKEQEKKLKFNPYFAMRAATVGLSELAGRAERRRQDMSFQQNMNSTLMNPMTVWDSQPRNPYNVYAKYGGKLGKFQRGGNYNPEYDAPATNTPVGSPTRVIKELPKGYVPTLNDFVIDKTEMDYLNNNYKEYCPNGQCLEVAFKAYDKLIGQKMPSNLFPTAEGYKKSLGIQSLTPDMYAKLNPKQKANIEKIPYMNPEKGDFTADSGDIHGIIIDNGGVNVYNATKDTPFHKMGAEERTLLYKKIPVGAIVGMGKDRYAGTYNEKKGLKANNHSAMVVGYDTDGTPIMYDYTKYTRLDDPTLSMDLTNISFPSQFSDKTKDGLQKQGLLERKYSPLAMKIEGAEYDAAEMNPFMQTISGQKKSLMNDLNLTSEQYDDLAKKVVSVSLQETRGGKDGEHNFQSLLGTTIGDTQGLTQLNINNLLQNPQLKSLALKYGIKTEKDLFDPKKAAIASMLYAKSNQVMADKYFKEGVKPGVRKFEMTRRGNSYNGDGFLVEETGKRVPTTRLGNSTFMFNGFGTRNVTDVQKDLDAQAPGTYTAKMEKGKVIIYKKTKGNAADLDDIDRFAYAWQNPNVLKTGDAQGKSEYAKKVKNYYRKIRTY